MGKAKCSCLTSALTLVVLVLCCEAMLPFSREQGGRQVWKRKMQVWPCLVFGLFSVSCPSCYPHPSIRRSLLCVVGIQILHKLCQRQLSEVSIGLKYCTPWGKTLEVASFSGAVTLQHANACLGLLWGLQDVFPPPPCPLPSRACNTSQPRSTFAGPFASIYQVLASELLLLRLHDSGPELHVQDPNLICATHYTKNVPPPDPMHCSFMCWKKRMVCTLVQCMLLPSYAEIWTKSNSTCSDENAIVPFVGSSAKSTEARSVLPVGALSCQASLKRHCDVYCTCSSATCWGACTAQHIYGNLVPRGKQDSSYISFPRPKHKEIAPCCFVGGK